jgi:hypothetical protein
LAVALFAGACAFAPHAAQLFPDRIPPTKARFAMHDVYLMAGQEYAACAEIGAAKNSTAINTAKTPEIRRKAFALLYLILNDR